MMEKWFKYNRDENSLTFRLFEKFYFEKFQTGEIKFSDFIKGIVNKSILNNFKFLKFHKEVSNDLIKAVNLKSNHLMDLFRLKNPVFINGRVLLEITDLTPFIKFSKPDKTEFDCVIHFRTTDNKYYLLTFEVKAYSNLNEEEVCRQNDFLEQIITNTSVDNYWHFCLISYSEFCNSKTTINNILEKVNTSILTWEDFYFPGFPIDFETLNLPLTISKDKKNPVLKLNRQLIEIADCKKSKIGSRIDNPILIWEEMEKKYQEEEKSNEIK